MLKLCKEAMISPEDKGTAFYLYTIIVYSPLDYERMNPSLVNGSILGLGAYLHQFFSHRPMPELGQYRTPINNFYMSGQSFHPGGSVIGGGRATVQVVMADLGIDFAQVIKP